jgi:DNA-directed RNA polymerase
LQVLSCIGDLFAGAKDIQDWLMTAARLITRSIPPERVERALQVVKSRPKGVAGGGQSRAKMVNRIQKELMSAVLWTTPLGLPVVQPYRMAFKKQVMTALQTVYVCDPNQPAQVSTTKQASAFPPNFVHSLDATHMLLTALECKVSRVLARGSCGADGLSAQ